MPNHQSKSIYHNPSTDPHVSLLYNPLYIICFKNTIYITGLTICTMLTQSADNYDIAFQRRSGNLFGYK